MYAVIFGCFEAFKIHTLVKLLSASSGHQLDLFLRYYPYWSMPEHCGIPNSHRNHCKSIICRCMQKDYQVHSWHHSTSAGMPLQSSFGAMPLRCTMQLILSTLSVLPHSKKMTRSSQVLASLCPTTVSLPTCPSRPRRTLVSRDVGAD